MYEDLNRIIISSTSNHNPTWKQCSKSIKNATLLEFAGFKKTDIHPLWWYPAGGATLSERELPDFTDPEFGTAHCFKWLVPKAIEQIKGKSNFVLSDFSAYLILFGRWWDEGFDALALCLAIEKLIGGNK